MTGNGGFIVRGVPLSEPLKVYDEPLPVVAVMLKSPAGGHGTAIVKSHTTSLVTVRVLVVGVGVGVGMGVVPLPGIPSVDGVDDTTGYCCGC